MTLLALLILQIFLRPVPIRVLFLLNNLQLVRGVLYEVLVLRHLLRIIVKFILIVLHTVRMWILRIGRRGIFTRRIALILNIRSDRSQQLLITSLIRFLRSPIIILTAATLRHLRFIVLH